MNQNQPVAHGKLHKSTNQKRLREFSVSNICLIRIMKFRFYHSKHFGLDSLSRNLNDYLQIKISIKLSAKEINETIF